MPAADAAAHGFFFALSEPVVTRPRFAASALIRRLWPEAMRAGTLARFEDQEIVNRFYWRAPAPAASLGDVERLLRHSEVRTPVLWLLGSDDEQERRLAERSAGAWTSPCCTRPSAPPPSRIAITPRQVVVRRGATGSADPERRRSCGPSPASCPETKRVRARFYARPLAPVRSSTALPWRWLAQRLG